MTSTSLPAAPTMNQELLNPSDDLVRRHIGPSDDEIRQMLDVLGYRSLDELTDATVPQNIRLNRPLNLPGTVASEHELLRQLRALAEKNQVCRSYIGMGFYDTIMPPVIQRNILENPGWYTAYTPYQAEISQGRLEALLTFQTMIADLTGLPMANASLLDEASAAVEAMSMCHAIVSVQDESKKTFFVASDCHPQTIAVVRTRAEAQGWELLVGDPLTTDFHQHKLFGVLLQYPGTDGRIVDYTQVVRTVHEAGALVAVAADPLALCLLKPPGEFGADIAIGSTQRFGVPMGFGGPHAAYMATKNEYARKMPGRIVGVSKDAHGNVAYRLAIQTREQHIRRERATSNICTAQVLPAVLASMYAVWHGPEGLKRIARRVHALTRTLAEGYRRIFERAGAPAKVAHDNFFDTITIEMASRECVETTIQAGRKLGLNLRDFGDHRVGISLDETTTLDDVRQLWRIPDTTFAEAEESELIAAGLQSKIENRKSEFLQHPVFNRYHAEHEMLRYLKRLESKDISLCQSMIPLGSCTMKLNATVEMLPITWPQFAKLHPFAPADQAKGYAELFERLEKWLAEITGFAAISLQPNAGSAGEYAGLLAIRAYHRSRDDHDRKVCLIPVSAHGTNPASAVLAGFEVVAVACDEQGNVDLADLEAKAKEHASRLGALMITYPSTHGVFEEGVKRACEIVHEHGGQVYMDGANMNAQVGLCRPGDIGADVCHLNLHKTFCIPHGGGGPGVGPIGVAEHLKPCLPGDPLDPSAGPVAAAHHGSASILPISYVYIALMGAAGLRKATQVAILGANYMAKQLEGDYTVLYRGRNGRVAHEFILDCRSFERSAGVKVEDIAKRLMDYGFHAPTMSFPVPGTLMIEPTESESKAELDRLVEALRQIRQEIRDIEEGRSDRADNVLKHSPHTAQACTADAWPHKYTREEAAYPVPGLRQFKYWPPVSRIDNAYGDRNLVCACPPMMN